MQIFHFILCDLEDMDSLYMLHIGGKKIYINKADIDFLCALDQNSCRMIITLHTPITVL